MKQIFHNSFHLPFGKEYVPVRANPFLQCSSSGREEFSKPSTDGRSLSTDGRSLWRRTGGGRGENLGQCCDAAQCVATPLEAGA